MSSVGDDVLSEHHTPWLFPFCSFFSLKLWCGGQECWVVGWLVGCSAFTIHHTWGGPLTTSGPGASVMLNLCLKNSAAHNQSRSSVAVFFFFIDLWHLAHICQVEYQKVTSYQASKVNWRGLSECMILKKNNKPRNELNIFREHLAGSQLVQTVKVGLALGTCIKVKG